MAHLEGRTILVTGGSRGIGAAIVEALAQDGARVIIHYGRDKAKAEALLAKIGGHGLALQADFTDPSEPTRLFAEAVKAAGRIHGVVNNAGIRNLIDITADLASWQAAWALEMQVNFQSVADLSRAALLHFREHGGGHIITMASRAGQRGYMGEALPYGVSKAALLNFSKSIARSFGHEGVVSILCSARDQLFVMTVAVSIRRIDHGHTGIQGTTDGLDGMFFVSGAIEALEYHGTVPESPDAWAIGSQSLLFDHEISP